MALDVAHRSLKANLVYGLAEVLREYSAIADGHAQDASPMLADALMLDALRERAETISA